MNDRPAAIFTRAHGVAPGAELPPEFAPPPEIPLREKRQQRQPRPAPTPPASASEDAQAQTSLPAHQLVLADLYLRKKLIDAAIQALEELYG